MAFLLGRPRVLYRSIPKSFAKTLHKSSTDEVASSDAITEFTDDLLSKRQLRWQIQQQKHRNESNHISRLKDVTNFINAIKRNTERSVSEVMFLSVDFEKLDETHIDHLVVTACRDKNNEFIEKFVDQCVDGNKVIGEKSVLTMLEYFSTTSDNKRTLIKLIDLCKLNNQLLYDENCEFKHFIARNLWEKGNSDGALTLLDEAYEKANTTVRTSIRSLFRFIVEDTVEKKSEAVLHRLIKSAVHIQERLNEPAVLLYIWKVCFLSSWFSDQVIADQLFDEYSDVRVNAAKRYTGRFFHKKRNFYSNLFLSLLKTGEDYSHTMLCVRVKLTLFTD